MCHSVRLSSGNGAVLPFWRNGAQSDELCEKTAAVGNAKWICAKNADPLVFYTFLKLFLYVVGEYPVLTEKIRLK